MSNYSNARVIFGLTTLMRVNEKRIKHYKSALDWSDDVDLILWFNRHASRLQAANATLQQSLTNYQGPRDFTGIQPSSQVSHWEQIRDILSLTRRNLLVEHCELLERNALKIYRTALALSFVPSSAVSDVQEQMEDIETGLVSLKSFSGRSRQLQVA